MDTKIVVERFHGIIPPHLPAAITLFVLLSANYNDGDFLLFDPQASRLYCFQVTVQAAECATHKWVTFGNPEVKQHYSALKYFKS